MVISIRPSDDNLSETTCTLRFGANAQKDMQLGPAKKNIHNTQPRDVWLTKGGGGKPKQDPMAAELLDEDEAWG